MRDLEIFTRNSNLKVNTIIPRIRVIDRDHSASVWGRNTTNSGARTGASKSYSARRAATRAQ